MRKKILLLILSVTCFTVGWSQSNIRLNHYWENPYTVTPAYISNQYRAEFSMAARHQWVSFDGAPTSLFLIGSTYIDKWQTQLGLKAFVDKVGYATTMDISLSYAYAVSLTDYWRLHLGIAGSYQYSSYDLSNMVVGVPNDGVLYSTLTDESYYNADLGVELASKSWRIGIAGQNILTSIKFFADKLNLSSEYQKTYNSYLQNYANFAYVNYRNYSKQIIDFSLGATGIIYGKGMNQLEFFGSIYYKTPPENNKYREMTDRLRLGLFYRTSSEIGGLATVYINPSFAISYCYDYNFSTIGWNTNGTHELILTYRIPAPGICIRCY